MHKVLISMNEMLFMDGLVNLLTKQADIDVASLLPDSGTNLFEEVAAYQPDLIILDEDFLSTRLHLLVTLPQEQPGSKIMTINVENNMVRVYGSQQFSITKWSDFIGYLNEGLA